MNQPIRNATSVAYLSILELLTLRHLPARLCVWQTAAMLGLEPQHIPVLILAKLIKPLGSPPRTAPKYFARDYVLQLASDEKWLARASDALVTHWARRNAKKGTK